MKKILAASLASAALVASLAGVAAADPSNTAAAPIKQTTQTTQTTQQVARVTDRTQQVGISRIVAPTPTNESGIDRTFHPDYSNALSVGQMSDAWNNEVIRVMEIPQNTGGG